MEVGVKYVYIHVKLFCSHYCQLDYQISVVMEPLSCCAKQDFH